jgi:hypothetical protein
MKDAAELCRGLLRKANSVRIAMEASLSARALDAACFHAQQMTEKCLKAFLAGWRRRCFLTSAIRRRHVSPRVVTRRTGHLPGPFGKSQTPNYGVCASPPRLKDPGRKQIFFLHRRAQNPPSHHYFTASS